MSQPTSSTRRGRIEVICGCMFAGKSKLLLERIRTAQADGKRVMAFKHASDDRYDDRRIVTHDGRQAECRPVPLAGQIVELAADADVIVVDEAQFFGEELVEAARQCARRGQQVICGGLDLDSWGLPFGAMPDLMDVADDVVKIQSICAVCGGPADYTQRTTPVDERMIGGPGDFEPRCQKHFRAPPIELRR